MKWTALILLLALSPANARDDGRYAQSQNKEYFDSLTDQHRMACCSNADGQRVDDPNWGRYEDGTYWVVLYGKRLNVPPEAIVSQQNRVGYSVVWPYSLPSDGLRIRCFMPGSET